MARSTNFFGRAFVRNGQWYVDYHGHDYSVINEINVADYRYLAVGRDENKKVFFDLVGKHAVITRIGSIRQVMANSLQQYCRKPRLAWQFSDSAGRPTVDLRTMMDAGLIRDGDKIRSS